MSIIIIFGIIFIAMAYNDPPVWSGNAANVGHSVDELDWSQTIQNDIKIEGSLTLKELKVSSPIIGINPECPSGMSPTMRFWKPITTQCHDSHRPGDNGDGWYYYTAPGGWGSEDTGVPCVNFPCGHRCGSTCNICPTNWEVVFCG